MGLPIVVGTKNITVLPLVNLEDEDEQPDESCPKYDSDEPRFVCTGSNADDDLLALARIFFGTMMRRGRCEHRFVELRVQISPLAQTFTTSQYRETVFRHPISAKNDYAEENVDNESCSTFAQTLFSKDGRFLTCLVPIPALSRKDYPVSIVIVFQLRKPRRSSVLQGHKPPLPSYIQRFDEVVSQVQQMVPVAVNPTILREAARANASHKPPPFRNASSLGDLHLASDRRSILLIGCADGSVLSMSYYDGSGIDEKIQRIGRAHTMIVHMDVIAALSSKDHWRSRLLTIDRNGSPELFNMSLILETKLSEGQQNGSLMTIKDLSESGNKQELRPAGSVATKISPTQSVVFATQQQNLDLSPHAIGPALESGVWMGTMHLLAVKVRDEKKVTVHVLLCSDGTTVGENKEQKAYPLSSISLNSQELLSGAHSTQTFDFLQAFPYSAIPSTFIQYQQRTECFVVSSHFSHHNERLHVGVVWHWRSNTQGMTIVKKSVCGAGANITENNLHSVAQLAQNSGSAYLVDISATRRSICKDMYEICLLSPGTSVESILESAMPLLVGRKSISFPRVRRSSTAADFELEWVECLLPSHYTTSAGLPGLSCIGRRWGRSIATASRSGLYTLDVGEKLQDINASSITTDFISSRGSVSSFTKLRGSFISSDNLAVGSTSTIIPMQGRDFPRWYGFGSDSASRSFRIIGMSWWEGTEQDPGNPYSNYFSDDLLMAILKIELENDEPAFFLSCWSKTNLELDQQLLKSVGDNAPSPWGLRLPNSFVPKKLSLLEQPHFSPLAPLNSRKAAVLLTSDDEYTGIMFFQLQLVVTNKEATIPESSIRPYSVLAAQKLRQSMTRKSDVFLAGCPFEFDLVSSDDAVRVDSSPKQYIATIGLSSPTGLELEAVALNQSCITHVGNVVSSDENFRASLISTVWPTAPIMIDGCWMICWTIQLLDGNILAWLVPMATNSGLMAGTRPVNQECSQLGSVLRRSKASDWIHADPSRTGIEFPLGPLRSLSFDFLTAVSQQKRKYHHTLGEDFEFSNLRSDILDHEFFSPGQFCVRSPSFLPFIFGIITRDLGNDIALISELDATLNSIIRTLLQERLFENSLLGMQLVVLRLVEQIAAQSHAKKGATDKLSHSLAALVDALRKNLPPIHMARFFLELGRQLEPSCQKHMFPLPRGTSGTSGGETVDSLLNMALDLGALEIAMSSLPLIPSEEEVFHHCNILLSSVVSMILQRKRKLWTDVATSSDEKAVGEVFRYWWNFVNAFGDTTECSESESSADEPIAPSILCGVSRMFGGKKDEREIAKAASSFISSVNASENSHPGTYFPGDVDSEEVIAAAILERLVSCVLGNKNDAWKKAALLCRVLLGSDFCDQELSSSSLLFDYMRRMTDTTPLEVEVGGTMQFLSKHTTLCNNQITAAAAGRIVDLIATISDVAGSRIESIGTLVLVFLVSVHRSDRTSEVRQLLDGQAPLASMYLDIIENSVRL